MPLKGGAVIARDPKLFARIRNAYRAEIEPMPAAVKSRMLVFASVLTGIQGQRRYQLFHYWRFQRTGTFSAESSDLAVSRGMFYRYDFTEWQAAVAMRQVERIDELVRRRQDAYARYRNELAGARTFALPPADHAREWAPIRFPIRVDGDKFAFYRQATKRGIDFAFSFTHIAAPPEMRHAHKLAGAVLDLPFYDRLTPDELDRTVAALQDLGRC